MADYPGASSVPDETGQSGPSEGDGSTGNGTHSNGRSRAHDAGRAEESFLASLRDRLDRVKLLVNELVEYAAFYASARVDKAAESIQKLMLVMTLAVVVGVFVAAAAVCAVALLLIGLSDGLGILLGNRPWLGNIVVGGGLIVVIVVAVWVGVGRLTKESRGALKAKYDARKTAQRSRFGRDVEHG